MGRIIQRTFSGYRVDLPEGLRLFVRKPNGDRVEIKDDIDFWAKQKFSYFQQLVDENKLEQAFESF